MGDRYVVEITCPNCGNMDENAWYAPTSGVVNWVCPECGYSVDMAQYTGISYEDASNAGEIEAIAEQVRMVAVKLQESRLWPIAVVDEIQKVMDEGKVRYPDNVWLSQSVAYHVDRAIVHLARYGADNEEDHLAHAFTRLMMACAIERGYVGGQPTKEKANVRA